jgi:hypothetical protein
MDLYVQVRYKTRAQKAFDSFGTVVTVKHPRNARDKIVAILYGFRDNVFDLV